MEIISIVYIILMIGGFYMEVNFGLVYFNFKYLKYFYKELQNYVKFQGVLELLIKFYDIY